MDEANKTAHEIATDIFLELSPIKSIEPKRNTFHDFLEMMLLKRKDLITADMMKSLDDHLEIYFLSDVLSMGECAGKVQSCTDKVLVLRMVNKMFGTFDKYYQINEKLIIQYFA